MVYSIYRSTFPAMNSSSKKSDASEGQLIAFFVAILVIIGLTGGAWMWMQRQQLPEEKTENLQSQLNTIPTPTPKPKPIPHGKITFTASTTWPGPKFSGGSFDPYDPSQGGSMVITVAASDTQPVQTMWATVKTDNKTSAKIPFTRVSGSDTNGEWQGTWKVDDTYLYTYIVTVEADSANGHTKDEIALR